MDHRPKHRTETIKLLEKTYNYVTFCIILKQDTKSSSDS